jgi:hypothetical protein
MSFVVAVVAAVVQFVLGFYGFWLVWRVLLPALPGPPDREDRVAPFVGYFTDPFIEPVAARLHVPARLVAACALVLVAAASVLVRRLSA